MPATSLFHAGTALSAHEVSFVTDSAETNPYANRRHRFENGIGSDKLKRQGEYGIGSSGSRERIDTNHKGL